MALRDGVVNLVLRLRDLMSKNADTASASLTALRDEGEKLDKKLNELGRQEAAIKGFDDTKRAADDATKELGRTVTEYERLRTEGRQAGQTQAEYALAVKQARTAQSIANTEYRKAQRELGRHVQTLNRAGIETDDLTRAETRVQRELAETREAFDRVNKEAATHAAQLDAASQSGAGFSGVLTGLRARLLGLVAGISVIEGLRRGFTALVGAAGGLEDLRLRLDGVFGSVEEGGRALGIIDQIAERNAQSLDATAEAALRLKSFGIDPLSGALQSLIDVNARYGQGAQTLETLTTQLGQGWASQRLQLEELNSITDAGIPILSALEKVTGRAGGTIREMASAGELGRDVMRELIAEFGNMAEGAGAARINTLNGLLNALRKEFRDLLRTAAESGALDVFRSKLRELLDTLRQAEEDGSSRRWAQNLVRSLEIAADVTSRVVAAARVGINAVTAVWRTGAAAITGSASLVSKALAELTDLVGAEGLSGRLDELSEKAGSISGSMLEGVKQDGRDIVSAFEDIFTSGAEAAEEGAQRQVNAQQEASDKILTQAQALANQEQVIAQETRTEKRVQRLQEARDAAESAEEIERIDRRLYLAQIVFSRNRAKRIIADRELEAAAAREAAEEQQRANNALRGSLDDLGLEYDKLAGVVERKAINSFGQVVEQVQKSGEEAKVQSRIITESYLAAFEEIESRAGRLQVQEQLNRALSEGLITQKDYNAALEETGVQASETLERLQRAIQIYKETTELATGAEKEKAAAAKETNQALDQQAAAAEEAGASMEESGRRAVVAGAGITEAAENIRRAFFNVSEEAGQLYDTLLKEQTRGLLSTRSYLNAVGDVATEVNERVGRAQQLYQRAMAAQNEDTGQFIRLAESAIASGRTLGEQKLSGLRSALASAKAQMDGLADSARDTVQGLKDELLQLTGTQEEIQRRQFERREQDLRDQLRQASEQGAGDAVAQYRDALQLNREVYQARRDQQRNEQLQQQQEQAQRQPVRKTEMTLKNDRGDRVTVTAAEGEDVAFLKLLSEAGLRSTQS